MGLLWWILPALSVVVGLMLSFAGVGRLMKLRLMAGGLRFLFGIGFLGLAGIVSFAGLNLQTYKRLTYEREVATIEFDKVANQDDTYVAKLKPVGEGEQPQTYTVKGDKFILGAQVIRFEPMAQMVGYDSVYRLDFLQWQYDTDRTATAPSKVEGENISLSENPGLDVFALAKAQGKRFGMQGTRFGSAVYDDMGDGYRYKIRLTQSALVLEPDNDVTRRERGQD